MKRIVSVTASLAVCDLQSRSLVGAVRSRRLVEATVAVPLSLAAPTRESPREAARQAAWESSEHDALFEAWCNAGGLSHLASFGSFKAILELRGLCSDGYELVSQALLEGLRHGDLFKREEALEALGTLVVEAAGEKPHVAAKCLDGLIETGLSEIGFLRKRVVGTLGSIVAKVGSQYPDLSQRCIDAVGGKAFADEFVGNRVVVVQVLAHMAIDLTSTHEDLAASCIAALSDTAFADRELVVRQRAVQSLADIVIAASCEPADICAQSISVLAVRALADHHFCVRAWVAEALFGMIVDLAEKNQDLAERCLELLASQAVYDFEIAGYVFRPSGSSVFKMLGDLVRGGVGERSGLTSRSLAPLLESAAHARDSRLRAHAIHILGTVATHAAAAAQLMPTLAAIASSDVYGHIREAASDAMREAARVR